MLKKRSILIAGHASSVSLEQEFWDALKAMADDMGQSVNHAVTAIDADRQGNLSSAIRVRVLMYWRDRAQAGHVSGPGVPADLR